METGREETMTIRNEDDFDGWLAERACEIAERTVRPYETRTVILTAEDGERLTVTIPARLPSNERGEKLRKLWDVHVRLIDVDWKGRVEAIVSESIVGDVQEAMEFMGAIVDRIEPKGDGTVRLYSSGYRAHGY
jgi:hypothetical protein